MFVKFLSFLFSCFFFLSLKAAENKSKKQIDNIDQFRKEVAQRHDKRVTFAEIPARKGHAVEGNPDQKKDKKELL